MRPESCLARIGDHSERRDCLLLNVFMDHNARVVGRVEEAQEARDDRV